MKLKNYIVALALGLFGLGLATSCDDMLDYEDGASTAVGKLDNPSDTATYVLGIISKMQALGVRTNILGEVRGDLVEVLSNATSDMKNIANFDFTDKTALINNRFNQPSDYYAVINNCNTFLRYVDTQKETTQPNGLDQSGNVKYKKLFEREYAVVKFIRAWVYLQLAINYGENIPFQTEPVLTVDEAMSTPNRKNMLEIINWFLNYDDLEKCRAIIEEQGYPHWYQGSGSFINSCHYMNLFFPGDLVLGDLYLWRSVLSKSQEDALSAARCYYNYLSSRDKRDGYMVSTGREGTLWAFSTGSYDAVNKTYNPSGITRWSTRRGGMMGLQDEYFPDNEVVSVLLMDTASSEGNYNMLNKYYTSNYDGEFEPACIVPSNRLKELTDTTTYCGGYSDESEAVIYSKDETGKKETIVYAEEYRTRHMTGDLRYTNYVSEGAQIFDEDDGRVSTIRNEKHVDIDGYKHVTIYRLTEVFLKLAEAMNYAGYPHYADAVLSFGVNDETMDAWILPNSPVGAENLLKKFSWDKRYYVTPVVFSDDTLRVLRDVDWTTKYTNNPDARGYMSGIHYRGSGSTHWNSRYYQLSNLKSIEKEPEIPEGAINTEGEVQRKEPDYMEFPKEPVKPSPDIEPDYDQTNPKKQPEELQKLYLYPFNPAHPDDPTEANVDEVTDVTVDNIYPEDECKTLWKNYYLKVYNNRTATSKTNTKWTNLSPNPYLKSSDSEVVKLSDYMGNWYFYRQELADYPNKVQQYADYLLNCAAYEVYHNYIATDYKNWRHRTRAQCLGQDQEMVAKMVLDEQALEFAYEGKRFYDLMRYAFWKGGGYGAPDTQVMVDAISKRNGSSRGSGVVGELSDYKNWFLRFWPSDELGIGPKQ